MATTTRDGVFPESRFSVPAGVAAANDKAYTPLVGSGTAAHRFNREPRKTASVTGRGVPHRCRYEREPAREPHAEIVPAFFISQSLRRYRGEVESSCH